MSTALTTARFGWLTFFGIIGFEVVGPAALVGQPIAGSTNRTVIESYLSHQALLPLGLGTMVLTLSFVVFATGLRDVLASRPRVALWANAGLGFALVATALLLVRSALEMAAVRGLTSGSDILPTFFAWDFTYDSAVYAMEAGYVIAFSTAVIAGFAPARWFIAVACLAAGLQVVNLASLVIGLPAAVTVPGNIVFAAWFGTMAWLAGRSFGSTETARP